MTFCKVDLYLDIDVSGQPIGHIFKDQEAQEKYFLGCLTTILLCATYQKGEVASALNQMYPVKSHIFLCIMSKIQKQVLNWNGQIDWIVKEK